MFKHSSYTAMPIGITGSLLKIRKQLENNDDDEIMIDKTRTKEYKND